MGEELNDLDLLNIRMEYGDVSFKESFGEYHLEILQKSNDEYELGILQNSGDSIYLSPDKAVLKQIKFKELLQLRSAINELIGRIEIDLQPKDVDSESTSNER